MGKIGKEISLLYYLDDAYKNKKRNVHLDELVRYLDVSEKQVRRYIEDLDKEICPIVSFKGPNGGYSLTEPLKNSFLIPENIVLAIGIAAKNNDEILKTLKELPSFINNDCIEGDNYISEELINNLLIVQKAIIDGAKLKMMYLDVEKEVYPYSIYFTNQTYYLYLVDTDNGKIKVFDISKMKDIEILDLFKINQDIMAKIKKCQANYGIKIDGEYKLILSYTSEDSLNVISKYYEHKVSVDKDKKEITIISNSKNELWYPLFRISTKYYKFVNEENKKDYIKYLKILVKHLENN